jgi:hypothetical protein
MGTKLKLLNLDSKKKKKKLPEWQAYSHLFYDLKIKDVVMENGQLNLLGCMRCK